MSSTADGQSTGLSAEHQAAILKCEQVVEEYRTKRRTRASTVRFLTNTLSATETGLDDVAADETLDSYLLQLDETDRIRKEAGQDLQRRFRGESDGAADGSRREAAEERPRPEEGPANGDDDASGRSNADAENHPSSSTIHTHESTELSFDQRLVLRKHRARSPSLESSSSEHASSSKRQRPDPTKFPWTAPEAELSKLLRPELRETLRNLKEFAKDVKFSKANLVNTAGAPEFPDSEWTNILNGRAVDLDHVLSNIYALSSDDKHIEHLGDVELRYHSVTPIKTVQSAGDWVIAWQRTALATVYAFPHRRAELDAYHTHIFGLFSAVDKSLHQRVIHYDRAVWKHVGSVRDLLLSDTDKFHDLRTLWIDSCGANVISGFDGGRSSRSSLRSRRDREACIRWNKGLCMAHPSDCRYRHVCSVCGGNHSKRNCKRDQQ